MIQADNTPSSNIFINKIGCLDHNFIVRQPNKIYYTIYGQYMDNPSIGNEFYARIQRAYGHPKY